MRRLERGRDAEATTARPEATEANLIERARRGEERAIAELYHCHVDAIYCYILTRVCDRLVAEDLTAQVFLKALEGLRTYRITDRPFRAWLYRIAHARVVDHYRRQKRGQEVELHEELLDRRPLPADCLEAEGEWAMALDLIAQLTDEQQDVIMLRFIGEMSLADVAETLAKSVGAVKALQHRALATISRLREEREACGDGPRAG